MRGEKTIGWRAGSSLAKIRFILCAPIASKVSIVIAIRLRQTHTSNLAFIIDRYKLPDEGVRHLRLAVSTTLMSLSPDWQHQSSTRINSNNNWKYAMPPHLHFSSLQVEALRSTATHQFSCTRPVYASTRRLIPRTEYLFCVQITLDVSHDSDPLPAQTTHRQSVLRNAALKPKATWIYCVPGHVGRCDPPN